MSHKISYILFLFAAVFSYGQVELAVVTEDRPLKVNERFTITFILEISGNEYVQESSLKLPDLSKFNMIGTASNRNTYVDSKTNTIINQLVYQVVVEPKEAGKVKLGSALVQVSGKMYKTEPSDIFINASEKKSNNYDDFASNDVYLNMEIKERNVYTNQPTIAVLRAYSRDFDNFRKVGNIILPEQNNVNFRTVSHQKSDIERVSGELVSQIIGVYLVLPTKSGTIEIEPISAKLKNKDIEIASNKINLNVKKLPSGSPLNYKNAVGNFSVDIENKSIEKAEVDKPINVVVKIKGEGNFVNVKLPKILPNENYRVFEPKISNNYISGNDGVKGEISAHYVVIPTKPGPISIETDNFSYFNPEEKKYIDIGSKYLAINVMSHEQILDSKTTLEKVNEYTNTILETVNTPVISTSALQVKEKDKLNWMTIVLNLTLFSGLVFLLFYVRKSFKKRKFALQHISSAKPIETIAEVEQKLKSHHTFSLSDDLNYLENLKNQKDSKKFISAYEEMVKSFEKRIYQKEKLPLNAYFEKNFGAQFVENFKFLSNKISIEKYSPLATDDTLDELYEEIFQLFSKIKE